ncbi:MAG: FAD/NAD(P)-binding protein [Myxococcota bacterium]
MVSALVDTAPLLPSARTVVSRIEETEGVVSLAWQREEADAPSAAGQFYMVYAFGVGEVPISVSGECESAESEVHTIRAVGAVTGALCEKQAGDVLGVRGPFGTPWPLSQGRGRDVVLVAGGIGLAPLRPAILALLRQRDAYRSLTLYYGAREPSGLLYASQLAEWAKAGLRVNTTVDAAPKAWRGHVGFVTTLIRRDRAPLDNAVAMVCGPEVMMRACADALFTRGIAPDSLFVSLERNMNCAVGTCGHCQLGPYFICRDGPVLPWSQIGALLGVRSL